ncbi:hypothetical protein PORY_000499 [Pneumocystis oryctolagi]|uniref:Uncharacterized protein n=1 Tax=Pneumocystis oryctolagi TaxID=42067 RepID=A0ACB7CFD1_9ASCO|nr:hypothetical protein PORY_000499 [Pneumocystis oryctolagi]
MFSTSHIGVGLAKRIDGVAIAQTIYEEIRKEIIERQAKSPRFQPTLAIIQVGTKEESNTYIHMKRKFAEKVNIQLRHIMFPESVQQDELLQKIFDLNNDYRVHGIIVQLPIPPHLSELAVTSAISPLKDVDGLSIVNAGELSKRNGTPFFTPCTPKGVMTIFRSVGIELEGKNVVILGRSDIVGIPMSHLLRNANATVTLCHSKSKDIKEITKRADILVVAIGHPEVVFADWIKLGAVVIDVGINYKKDPSKKSGYRLVGDVHYESVSKAASYITPVPGGVGPLTVCMLLQNVLESSKRIESFMRSRSISPLPLKLLDPVPSDLVISKSQTPKNIQVLAKEIGIFNNELDVYGNYKAKVNLNILERLAHRKDGYYVCVTGITPTPLGEGKTTTVIGLSQALGAHCGKLAFACIRQPSQGPTFGIKGGASGGGYSQVIPMDEFNLHLTGDIHAVTASNNLLAASIDTRIFHESTQSNKSLYSKLLSTQKDKLKFSPIMEKRLEKLGINKTDPNSLTSEEIEKFVRLDIDPSTITWRRVLDVNDRFLRKITIGQNSTEKGLERVSGFDISVASECMAILALSDDMKDLRKRLGNIVVANTRSGDIVTADDIGVGGALAVLMKDAIKPNLMQSMEGTPVFVHTGPFANIAHGNSSILADKIALKLAGIEEDEIRENDAGYVITEAGFGADAGLEKFFDIKTRISGLSPDAVVLVATIKALKYHGGAPEIVSGKPVNDIYFTENPELVEKGCSNMVKHIENIKKYGIPVVVAINRFKTDTEAEINIVRDIALKAGAVDAVTSNHWALGGRGSIELAKSVQYACEKVSKKFKFLYELNLPIIKKIEIISKEIYGADGIQLSELAEKKIQKYTELGFGNLPICMAKTQYSFSHDPKLRGAPTNFVVPIKDVRLNAGAGFIIPLLAEIMTIPGLPTRPAYYDVDINSETYEVEGLIVKNRFYIFFKINVLFVCLGNICRSTMAHGLNNYISKYQLQDNFGIIDSCGTSAYNIGSKPDYRTSLVLKKHGITYNHRARQLCKSDFETFDYILVMDLSNLRDVNNKCPKNSRAKVQLFGDYGNENEDKIVHDPYYLQGGIEGFEEIFVQLSSFTKGFCCKILEKQL